MSTENKEVIIEAVKGSRRFDNIRDLAQNNTNVAEIKSYQQVAEINGEHMTENLGQYLKQRFPGSKQRILPTFDSGIGQFLLGKENGELWSQTDLDAAVKKINIRYPDWKSMGIKAGERVTKSDIFDVGDYFLSSKDVAIRLEEGEGALNPNTPLGELKLAILRGHRSFMDEGVSTIRSEEVEYLIKHPEVSEKREVLQREEKELAWEYYNGMKTDPERMTNILRMFGIDVSESSSTESKRNLIFKKLEDTTNRENGFTNQALLNKYAALSPDELALKSLLKLAVSRSIIVNKGGIYMYQETPLAATFEATYEMVNRGDMSHIKDSIRLQLDSYKDKYK